MFLQLLASDGTFTVLLLGNHPAVDKMPPQDVFSHNSAASERAEMF